MVNKDETLLLARYLVEDNDSDFIMLNLNAEQSVNVVKSILKNIL